MNFQKRLLEIVTPTLFLPPRKNLLLQKTSCSTRKTFFCCPHTIFFLACIYGASEVQNKTTMLEGLGGNTAFICVEGKSN